MPDIDVMDSTWIAARPSIVAPLVADETCWPRWWPGLVLAVEQDRGPKGVRWLVTAGPDSTHGTMELWLQPSLDGTIAHFFLRLDYPAGHRASARRRDAVTARYRRRTKRALWALGDRLDPERLTRLSSTRPIDPPAATPGRPGAHR